MTDILCTWLNIEVHLDITASRETFGELFWNGYRFGYLLNRYMLQPNFQLFSPKKTREAAIKNFGMLRESLEKLKIELSPWTISEIRQKNICRIRTLLYQIYIALKNHQKQRSSFLNGPAVYSTIESISRPATHMVQSGEDTNDYTYIFRDRRGKTDMDIDAMIEERRQRLHNSAEISKQNTLLKCQKKSLKSLKNKDAEYEKMKSDILNFEARIQKKSNISTDAQNINSDEYLEKIKKSGIQHRDKTLKSSRRRRKMFVETVEDMFKTQQEDRGKYLMSRVTRESALERRLATQLLGVRLEKEILVNNRIRLNNEFENQRKQQYADYLERETEHLRIQKENQKDILNAKLEENRKVLENKKMKTKIKHENICRSAVNDLISFAMNLVVLNKKTSSNIPIQLIKYSRELFIKEIDVRESSTDEAANLLDGNDQEEYLLTIGDWTPQDEHIETTNKIFDHFGKKLLEIVNPESEDEQKDIWPLRLGIVGKDKASLNEIVHEMAKKHPLVIINPTDLVNQALEAAANNEIVTHKLSKEETVGSFEVLEASQINTPSTKSRASSAKPKESLNSNSAVAFQDQQSANIINEESTGQLVNDVTEKLNKISANSEDLIGSNEEPVFPYETTSDRAKLGIELATFLENGEEIPLKLLIETINEALNRVPYSSGWIIEGFPSRLDQYEMFQKNISLQAILYIDSSDDNIIQNNSEKQSPDPKIEQYLSTFNDNWEELRTIYNKKIHIFSPLEGDILEKIEDEILEIVRLDNYKAALEVEAEVTPLESPKLETVVEPKDVPDPPVKEERSRPSSSKRGRSADTKKRPGTAKSTSSKGSKSPGSAKSLASSGKGKKKVKKEEVKKVPEVKPGDDTWEWVLVSNDENVPEDFYHRLHQAVIDADNLAKRRLLKTLNNIRQEKYSTIEYFGGILSSFHHFVARPDPKQEYVSLWQVNFNQIDADLRKDVEIQSELHQRLADLQEDLYDVADGRKRESEEERKGLMTNTWLADKLKLVTTHFVNLGKQEVIKAAVRSAVLRKHYAFQAEMLAISNPFKKEVFSAKPCPDINFDIEIETEELADSEDVVILADYNTKSAQIFDFIVGTLSELQNYETGICNEIKYTLPKSVEATVSKSPKGKKSPKPAKGKKGKKSVTPTEDKGPDPVLLEKQQRGEKCREEAKEGIRLIMANSEKRIGLIKHVLLKAVIDTKDRFERTFKILYDIIGSQFNNEVTSIEELGYVAQSAIQNEVPLIKPFYLKDYFVVDGQRKIDSSVPIPPRSPPEIVDKLTKAYHDLRKTNNLPLSLLEAHVLSKDLGVNKKVTDFAGGDWRIILFAVVNIDPCLEDTMRRICSASGDECLIQYSMWQSLTHNSYPLTELGWSLSVNGKLSLSLVLKIKDIQNKKPEVPQSILKNVTNSCNSIPE